MAYKPRTGSDRRFKTEASAKQAVRREGLHAVEHRIEWIDDRDGGYGVIFTVDLLVDQKEILSRGFRAGIRKTTP